MRLAGALLAVLLARPVYALTEGQVMENYSDGKFFMGGGATIYIDRTGYNPYGFANSFTAWVRVTDTPQLCLRVWKNAAFSKVEAGSQVCFTISFSNCGGYSGFNLKLIDALPPNTMYAPDPPNPEWVGGPNYIPQKHYWATSVDGPWLDSAYLIGQIGPIFVRWGVFNLGIEQSGWIKYCVSVL